LAGKGETEAFMLGDKENLHYVVGLTGKEYSIILDLDDFNSIKDLTRLKMGLSIKGIKILRDEFTTDAEFIKRFECEAQAAASLTKNTIEYFNRIIEILNSYNIDSQGFCEYMRTIIEGEEIQIEKVWREVKGNIEKRYSRCLTFDFNSKTYLLDSVDKTLKEVNKEAIN